MITGQNLKVLIWLFLVKRGQKMMLGNVLECYNYTLLVRMKHLLYFCVR